MSGDLEAHLAPEGRCTGMEFEAKARTLVPRRTRSVHLKLDPEVFEFFVTEASGIHQLTRMQAVLWAQVGKARNECLPYNPWGGFLAFGGY